tara:strand:- start:205 stop:399 length:195 start_codon:yes stop_codon:yes gene_type:complete
MKKLIPFIAFACLTGLTATSGLPVMAGGCSGNYNKTAKIKCAEDDKECQKDESDAFNLKETIKS